MSTIYPNTIFALEWGRYTQIRD
ncbi:DUF1566 domain-containing protein, partial [Xylella fastidiosa]|nr:DUF1566 domain-containing protein [Xylella fastidiosa]